MEKNTHVQFDPNEWIELAKSDQEAFERKREEAIEAVISRAQPHHQMRLRRLQWRIDMERKRCRTPMAACLRLYSMMWEKVCEKDGFLESLRMLSDSASPAPRHHTAVSIPARTAKVLPFGARRANVD